MTKPKLPADAGVLETHRHRMEHDKSYRDTTLTAPVGTRGKYLTNTAPTLMTADRDKQAKINERTKPQRDGHAILDDTLAENA